MFAVQLRFREMPDPDRRVGETIPVIIGVMTGVILDRITEELSSPPFKGRAFFIIRQSCGKTITSPMVSRSVRSNTGLVFGPDASGKKYLSAYVHRRPGNPLKHQWDPTVSPDMEYSVFCEADTAHWIDNKGNYWGIHNGGRTVLGTQRERLCKFPKNSNATDPWHGYPVSPKEDEDDCPPDDFVNTWIANNVVTRTVGKRIQRRKI